MDKELLKELKENGFPFRNIGDTITFNGTTLEITDCEPTLEELIEACGDKFHCLNQHKTWSAIGEPLYRAEPKGQNYKDMVNGTGKTPTEAVAKLWLALNKK